jgi:hypothetical protein
MKLKRKLLSIISYICCPTLNFPRYLYYIWILWWSFVHHREVHSITTQTYLHLAEFLWTKYVRSKLCSVLNIDQMKSWFSLGIFWPALLLDWNLLPRETMWRIYGSEMWCWLWELCYDCYVAEWHTFIILEWMLRPSALVVTPLFYK